MAIDLIKALQSDNVADMLDHDELQEIAMRSITEYHSDESSRSEWKDRNDKWVKLAMQVQTNKSYPWPNSSNVKYPLITTAAIQFHARAYPSIAPAPNIVKTRVIGGNADTAELKRERGKRIEQHMNYQLLEEMETWEEDMDKLALVLPIVGVAFKKTYHDPTTKINRSDLIMPDDLVVDYHTKTLKDAERITHKYTISANEFEGLVRQKLFLKPVSPTGSEDDALEGDTVRLSSVNDTRDSITGVADMSVYERGPRELIEQHRYLDLDDDGFEEPYIVTIDMDSGQVVRITARWAEDTDVEINDAGEVFYINPICMFTKYEFIPNPDGGFYSVGFGLLLGDINESSNTLINQLIDAGSLSNMQGGFLGRGFRIRGGNYRFKPGEWKMVDNRSQKIGDSIFPMPVREPSQVLFQLLGTLLQAGERVSSVSDVLTGESPGQNQPASTTIAVIEQGLKVVQAIFKRMHRSLKKELKALYTLNSIHLDQETYFIAIGEEDGEELSVARLDYNPEDFSVIPSSDPNIVSKTQEMFQVQSLIEGRQQGLLIDNMYLTKKYLEASGIYDEAAISEPQPDPAAASEQAKQQLEQDKFDFEKILEEAKLALETVRVEGEAIKDKGVAVSALARADQEKVSKSLDNLIRLAETQLKIDAGESSGTNTGAGGNVDTQPSDEGGAGDVN